MREPDLNRVRKARTHLSAAVALLNSIKWENINQNEDEFRRYAKEDIGLADNYLADIEHIQGR